MNFKLRRNSHEIHHLKAEQLSGIWHSHMLYNHHLYFQNIPTALKGTPSPLTATRHSLLPQRLATPSLLSVSTEFPLFCINCLQSYGMCLRVWLLALSTQLLKFLHATTTLPHSFYRLNNIPL